MAKKVSIIVLIILAAISLVFLLDIPTSIKAAMFTPSERFSGIMSDLSLTSSGEKILKSTTPELEESDIFNDNCDAINTEAYVLGCFTPHTRKIHLYNIVSDDFPGILESTAAHELLHAIWNRLNVWEKNSLTASMMDYYNNLPQDSELRKTLELYSHDEFYDELHSRLGTEVKDLSDTLENHFSNYFSDRAKIVGYFDSYNSKYKALESELKQLEEEITAESEVVDSETKHYNDWGEELNSKIVEFNSKVDDMSYSEYESERSKLSSEIDKFNTYYKNLNKKITALNQKITSYNEKSIKHQEAIKQIDSAAEKPENTVLSGPNLNLKKGQND